MPNDPRPAFPEAPPLDPFLDTSAEPEPGTALCLSGGGYRAMLFHVGALWRLNDAKLLASLKRISSVSGGSITAGLLAVMAIVIIALFTMRRPARPDQTEIGPTGSSPG